MENLVFIFIKISRFIIYVEPVEPFNYCKAGYVYEAWCLKKEIMNFGNKSEKYIFF